MQLQRCRLLPALALPLTLGLLFGLAFALQSVRAQTVSDPSSEKAKSVLKLALEALGGDHYLNMHSRLTNGRIYSFFRDQTNGTEIARIYTEYLPSPPKNGVAIRERQLLGKKMDYSYLFLENQAWEITFRGARPVASDVLDRYRRTTENDILYILKFRANEPGMYFDFISSAVELNRHVEVIEISDSERRTVRVAFDHNTHLPIHETFSWLEPDTRYRNDEEMEFDKFRDIGSGVQWPFTVERARNGYKTFQMFANSMEANAEPPPNTFSLPAGAKVLGAK